MSRYVRRWGIGLAAGAAALLLVVPGAQAATPDCGDQIKKDVKFTKNLNCTNANVGGLEIVKSGVEIDLNGKKLIGPDGSYYGIDVDDRDSVTIKNGTIKGFGTAVYGYYASGLKVINTDIDLRGSNSSYGISNDYAFGTTVKNLEISNPYYGLDLYDITNLVIDNVKVTDSDDQQSYGLYGAYLTGKINKFRANGAYYGLYVYGEAQPLKITKSKANNAGYAGFYISNSTPLSEHRYILQDNTANNSDSYGFYASYDTGGSGNKAKGAGSQNCYNVPCFR